MKPFSFKWYIEVIIKCAERSASYYIATPYLPHKDSFDYIQRYDVLLEFLKQRFYEKYEK